MSEPFRYVACAGSDLERVGTKIAYAVEGEDVQIVMVSCLAIAISVLCPTIDVHNLMKGVTGASEYISLFGQSLEPLEKEQVN